MAIKCELVARRATTDTPAARALARSISDPWYRCQALAWVAHFAPKAQFKAIAQESLAAGNAADDPYQPMDAEQIVTSMPDGRHKRQVTRRIAARQYQSPRKFFWHV